MYGVSLNRPPTTVRPIQRPYDSWLEPFPSGRCHLDSRGCTPLAPPGPPGLLGLLGLGCAAGCVFGHSYARVGLSDKGGRLGPDGFGEGRGAGCCRGCCLGGGMRARYTKRRQDGRGAGADGVRELLRGLPSVRRTGSRRSAAVRGVERDSHPNNTPYITRRPS